MDTNSKGITTGLRYANGPIGVALTYDQVKNDAAEAIFGTDKVQQWNIGASYDFEVVKLHAGFGQTRDGLIGAYGYQGLGVSGTIFAEDLDANLYTVGLSAPVGASGRVMASWAMADFDDVGGVKMEKQNIYSLGYTHGISKRTNVYAYGSYAKDLYGIDDTKSTAIGVGVRHQF